MVDKATERLGTGMSISSGDKTGNKIPVDESRDQLQDVVNSETLTESAPVQHDGSPVSPVRAALDAHSEKVGSDSGETVLIEGGNSDSNKEIERKVADASNLSGIEVNQAETSGTNEHGTNSINEPGASAEPKADENETADQRAEKSRVTAEEKISPDGSNDEISPNARSIPPAVKRTGLAAKVLAKREATEAAAEQQRTTGSTSSSSSSLPPAGRDSQSVTGSTSQRTTGATHINGDNAQKNTGTTRTSADLSQRSTGTTRLGEDLSQRSLGQTRTEADISQRSTGTTRTGADLAQRSTGATRLGMDLSQRSTGSTPANLDSSQRTTGSAFIRKSANALPGVPGEKVDVGGEKVDSGIGLEQKNDSPGIAQNSSILDAGSSGNEGIRSSVNAKGVKSRDNEALKVSTFRKIINSGPRPIIVGLVLVGITSFVTVSYLRALQDSSRETELAADLINHSQYKDAVKVLGKALSTNRTAAAYLLRGRAYELLNDNKHAFDDYSSAVKLQPKNSNALRSLGRLSLSKKDFKAAIGYFERCLNSLTVEEKLSSDVQSSLATALMQNGEYSKAAELYEDTATKRNDSTALIEAARCLMCGQKIEQAIPLLDKVLKAQPKSVDALILRAACHERMFDKSLALADLNAAIEIQPHSPVPLCARGAMFAHFNDFPSSARDLRRALLINPNYYEAYIERARLFLLQGDLKSCAEQLSSVSNMKGFHVDAKYQLVQADLLNKQGDYQKCLDVLKATVVTDPNIATQYKLAMATAYLGLKRNGDAMLWCNKILSVQVNNPEALLINAEINQRSGNENAAKLDFFRVVELEPKNPEAYEKRGAFLMANKQYGAASEDFKKALTLAPARAELKAQLALCKKQMSLIHGQKVEVDRTKLTAAELKEIGAADAQSLKTLGYDALKQSRVSYATAALTRAVSLTPNDPMARRYLTYALLAAQDCNGAIEQFYAWEKLETISDEDEMAFVKGVADAGDSDKAKTLVERLTTKFSKSSASLLKLANLCLTLKFNIAGLNVIKAGLKVASPAEKIQFEKLTTEFDHLEQSPSIKVDLNPIGKS